ncbi:Smr/MutS family protein [Blastochloris sulfoviridis]|uniref:DNA mismatch repair protein MutS n=1 Tax=Blastochloris sulfoviridis TaxID=50712 RepID=A0A5M6HXS1_9HYPH|nr:Smr/MutS family protein [Blastochloris sulfoviridis]KAA5600418.1 DNA mismatch repair protein MutS [Blastochloris sulfoviridis]
MSPRRPRGPLTDDERALWEHVTRDIKPLRGRKPRRRPAVEPDIESKAAAEVPDTGQPAVHPASRPGRAAPKASPAPEPARKPAPPLAPLERRTRLRLVRGVVEIDARIDLHGLTRREAHDRLLRFLVQAQAHGARIVLVITGKGAPGAVTHFGHERGVLRREVPLWLGSAELRPLVVGFETAHAVHGGEGALYVRVRRRG